MRNILFVMLIVWVCFVENSVAYNYITWQAQKGEHGYWNYVGIDVDDLSGVTGCFLKGPNMPDYIGAGWETGRTQWYSRLFYSSLNELQLNSVGTWSLKLVYNDMSESVCTFTILGPLEATDFPAVPSIIEPAAGASSVIAEHYNLIWQSNGADTLATLLGAEVGGDGFFYSSYSIPVSSISWKPGWLKTGDAYLRISYLRDCTSQVFVYPSHVSGPEIVWHFVRAYTASGTQNEFYVKYSLDFNKDNRIDISDLDMFLSMWLSQTPNAITDGMVGHWSFDEGAGNTAIDVSGNGNHGTIYGGNYVDGVSGTALKLNGIDNYVDCGNSTELNPTDQITLAAWYKAEAFVGTGNEPIIDKGYVSHTFPHYQYHLGVTGNQYHHDIAAFNFSADTEVCYVDHSWSPNNWYFIVGTYDSVALKLYINGMLAQDYETNLTMANYGKNLLFGKYTNLNKYLPGTIDEVRIYNRGLSNSEVNYLYYVPNGVGHYAADFNDDGVVNLSDFSILTEHWMETN